MTLLLLTLLVIVLVVISVGVLLSHRPTASEPTYKALYKSVARRFVQNRYINMLRSIVSDWRYPLWAKIAPLLDIRTLFHKQTGRQTPWVGILLSLLCLFLLGLSFLQSLTPEETQVLPQAKPETGSVSPPSHTTTKNEPKSNASLAVKRLSQVVPEQYNSYGDFETWSPSACSAASMAVVLNAYGKNFRVADVLETEIRVNAISSDLGLLEPAGIDRAAEKYHFQTRWLGNGSADEVLKAANSGTPVIVNFGPQPAWPGGHILVVSGSDENKVYLADSSAYDIQAMSHEEFAKQLTSFAVVLTPK